MTQQRHSGRSRWAAHALPPRALPATLALALAAAGCVAGCAAEQRCLPSPLSATVDHATAGSRLTISSPAFACSASYLVGKTYTLVLDLVGRGAPIRLGSTPVAQDGSFTTTVMVPPDTSPGEAYVEAKGSAFDHCDDSAGVGSCATYSVRITVPPRS